QDGEVLRIFDLQLLLRLLGRLRVEQVAIESCVLRRADPCQPGEELTRGCVQAHRGLQGADAAHRGSEMSDGIVNPWDGTVSTGSARHQARGARRLFRG